MRALLTLVACAVVGLVTGCAGTAEGPHAVALARAAPGPRPAVQGSELIAITGVTLKTDQEVVQITRPDGSGSYELPLPAALLPVAVTWSPDGKQLAVNVGAIFVAGAGGQRLRQLTPGALNPGAAVSWSPDGRWIAFTGYADGYYSAAYLIRPDGTGLHQVLKGFDVDWLAWGPGGRLAILALPHRSVQLAARAAPPPTGIWTADASGAHVRLVTGPAALSGWSPDGRWLLIQNRSGLSVVPAAGGRPRVLVRAPSRGYLSAAAWSPDGGAVIVAVNPGGAGVAQVRFYRVPAAGGRLMPADLPLMRVVMSLAWQRPGST